MENPLFKLLELSDEELRELIRTDTKKLEGFMGINWSRGSLEFRAANYVLLGRIFERGNKLIFYNRMYEESYGGALLDNLKSDDKELLIEFLSHLSEIYSSPEVFYAVGCLYIDKDIHEAHNWFRKARQHGSVIAYKSPKVRKLPGYNHTKAWYDIMEYESRKGFALYGLDYGITNKEAIDVLTQNIDCLAGVILDLRTRLDKLKREVRYLPGVGREYINHEGRFFSEQTGN